MSKRLHHVEYRCRDAAETVDFYTRVIGMKFAASLIDHAPSDGVRPTHNNIFFETEDGGYLCFFDIIGDDGPLVPLDNEWAQHLALEVKDTESAEQIAARLHAYGTAVEGPVIHEVAGDRGHVEVARSWYFRDPNGHRLELLLTSGIAQTKIWNDLAKNAHAELERWVALKRSAAA